MHLALAAAWVLLIDSAFAADPGTVEGQLRVATDTAVQLDEPADAGPNYAQYLLIVRSSDGMKEVARTTADRTGKYRLSLPSGDYVLAVGKHGSNAARSTPQKFTITAGKTIRVDVPVMPNLTVVAPGRIQSD